MLFAVLLLLALVAAHRRGRRDRLRCVVSRVVRLVCSVFVVLVVAKFVLLLLFSSLVRVLIAIITVRVVVVLDVVLVVRHGRRLLGALERVFTHGHLVGHVLERVHGGR